MGTQTPARCLDAARHRPRRHAVRPHVRRLHARRTRRRRASTCTAPPNGAAAHADVPARSSALCQTADVGTDAAMHESSCSIAMPLDTGTAAVPGDAARRPVDEPVLPPQAAGSHDARLAAPSRCSAVRQRARACSAAEVHARQSTATERRRGLRRGRVLGRSADGNVRRDARAAERPHRSRRDRAAAARDPGRTAGSATSRSTRRSRSPAASRRTAAADAVRHARRSPRRSRSRGRRCSRAAPAFTRDRRSPGRRRARWRSSFSIPCRARHDGDPPYIVTIVPDGRRRSRRPTARLAARARAAAARTLMPRPTTSSQHDHARQRPSVAVHRAARSPTRPAHALTSYRVVALGRWRRRRAGAPRSRRSPTRPTASTRSRCRRRHRSGTIEIVAQPYDATAVAPTLHLARRRARCRPTTRSRSRPTSAASRSRSTFRSTARPADGERAPVERRARDRPRPGHVDSAASTATARRLAVQTPRPTTTASRNLTMLDGTALASATRCRSCRRRARTLGVDLRPSRLDGTITGTMPVRLPSRVALPRHRRRSRRQAARQRRR